MSRTKQAASAAALERGRKVRNLSLELEQNPPNVIPLREAQRIRRTFYASFGYKSAPAIMTKPDANRKMAKSEAPTYGVTLAAADMAGDLNTCTWSTTECRLACVLVTSGNAVKYPAINRARILKTRFLAEHPDAFLTLLMHEIRLAVRKHGAIVVRLNVASDLRWERIAPELFKIAGARFYDYTKAPVSQRTPTDNYRLTYSVSERPHSTSNALEALEALANAAVVFERTPAGLPATWHGFDVIDGDASDDRTQDRPGTVVGLLAKGSARYVAGADDAFIKPAVAS